MCQSTVGDAAAPVKRLLVALGMALALALATTPASAQHLAHVSGMVHGTGGSFSIQSRTSGAPSLRVATLGLRRLPYPYALGYAGIAAIETRDARIDTPVVVGLLEASAGYVLDDIARGQLSARLRIAGFFDIEGRYDAYFERTGAAVRGLGIARLGVGFRTLAEAFMEMHVGAAVLVYQDALGVAPGYGVTCDLEAYPISPLVVRGEVALGQLSGAFYLDGRATLGVQLGPAEIYAGYHAFVLETNTQSDLLHGPVLGIRIWIT